jgi:hypothetical protein
MKSTHWHRSVLPRGMKMMIAGISRLDLRSDPTASAFFVFQTEDRHYIGYVGGRIGFSDKTRLFVKVCVKLLQSEAATTITCRGYLEAIYATEVEVQLNRNSLDGADPFCRRGMRIMIGGIPRMRR